MYKHENEDIVESYKCITSKLRKRFLRKPNVAEASEEFHALSLRCERMQNFEFAGLCSLGVAKCEGSLGNSHLENESLLKAARSFYCAANLDRKIGSILVKNENKNASLNCYHHAISRYRENSPLCIAAHMEAKHALQNDLTKDVDLDHIKNINPNLTLIALTDKMETVIENGDYNTALEVIHQMDSCIPSARGFYKDTMIRNEITKMLLLIILEPPIGKLTMSQAKLIEKYSWADFNDSKDGFELPKHLDFLLRSLVAAWQCKDVRSFKTIRVQLVPYLTSTQKKLLANITRKQLV
uniref:Factor VIII intron 22 protein n=1 Tax=Xenopsylla cheopis TaxID=163159 RepID=A0A6M2DEV4_XENCH